MAQSISTFLNYKGLFLLQNEIVTLSSLESVA